MNPKTTTDQFRLKVSHALCELGVGLQHLHQCEEDLAHGTAVGIPELAEFQECLDNAVEIIEEAKSSAGLLIAFMESGIEPNPCPPVSIRGSC